MPFFPWVAPLAELERRVAGLEEKLHTPGQDRDGTRGALEALEALRKDVEARRKDLEALRKELVEGGVLPGSAGNPAVAPEPPACELESPACELETVAQPASELAPAPPGCAPTLEVRVLASVETGDRTVPNEKVGSGFSEEEQVMGQDALPAEARTEPVPAGTSAPGSGTEPGPGLSVEPGLTPSPTLGPRPEAEAGPTPGADPGPTPSLSPGPTPNRESGPAPDPEPGLSAGGTASGSGPEAAGAAQTTMENAAAEPPPPAVSGPGSAEPAAGSPPEAPTGPTPSLVETILADQREQRVSDSGKLAEFHDLARGWQRRNKKLIEGLREATSEVDTLLEVSGKLQADFPPPLQEALAGRQSGLELVRRMYGRLMTEGGELVEEEENAEPALPELPASECHALVFGLAADEAEKRLKERVRAHSEECWRLVTGRRDLADQRARRCKSFIERKVLPILDALEDGNRVSEPLIQQQVRDYPDRETPLREWLNTYPELSRCLLARLEAVGVSRIEMPEADAPMDFNRFEPFETIAAPDRKDETVAEITRSGYELELTPGGGKVLIRPAQVTVVKN